MNTPQSPPMTIIHSEIDINIKGVNNNHRENTEDESEP